ncbi:metalloendopeptidase [Aureococcus anophagefferens]|uniref:Metalloendopeptidase n=1 Tax=Aureococcus anophagefferens TaxID=44056 RepID=A0ABR1FXB4_AURAN
MVGGTASPRRACRCPCAGPGAEPRAHGAAHDLWVVVALIGVTPKPIRKAIYQGGKSATIGTVALAYRVGHAIETKRARAKGAVLRLVLQVRKVRRGPRGGLVELRHGDADGGADGDAVLGPLLDRRRHPRFNAIKESHAWTTSAQWEDVHASVLVDTYGYARGVDVDLNGSVVYFTVDGCIGKMEGLAVYNWMNLLFWVDYKTGWLYAAQLHVYGRTMDDVPKSATVRGNGTYAELRRFRDPPGRTRRSSGACTRATRGETVTDGGVTRLFLREWANGTSADLAKSVPFVYDVVGLFYELEARAVGTELFCTARLPAGAELASIDTISQTYANGTVGIGAPPGPHYWGSLDVSGTTFGAPTAAPSAFPAEAPTSADPSSAPSYAPSPTPTTEAPAAAPEPYPTTILPTACPITEAKRDRLPTAVPSHRHIFPTYGPTFSPSAPPSEPPSSTPSNAPSSAPSPAPSAAPTSPPTPGPSSAPSVNPTLPQRRAVAFSVVDAVGGAPAVAVEAADAVPHGVPDAARRRRRAAPSAVPSPQPSISCDDGDSLYRFVLGSGETLNFCSEPDFQGWAVQSGRMVFGAAEAGRRCLAKSSSRDYVTIYGSHYNYTDDDLDIRAEIAFSSGELTSSHRDSVVAFRIADWPEENSTDFADARGYGCKVVSQDGSNAASVLELREYGDAFTTLASSKTFPYVSDTFYLVDVRASDTELFCTITQEALGVSARPASSDLVGDSAGKQFDAMGDGWGDCAYALYNRTDDAKVISGSLLGGSFGETWECLADGCFVLTVAHEGDCDDADDITFKLLGEFDDAVVCEHPPCTDELCLAGGAFYDAPTRAPTRRRVLPDGGAVAAAHDAAVAGPVAAADGPSVPESLGFPERRAGAPADALPDRGADDGAPSELPSPGPTHSQSYYLDLPTSAPTVSPRPTYAPSAAPTTASPARSRRAPSPSGRPRADVDSVAAAVGRAVFAAVGGAVVAALGRAVVAPEPRARARADAGAGVGAVARALDPTGPSPLPTHRGDTFTFCDQIEDWEVESGRLLFNRTFAGRSCVMEADDAYSVNVYGSTQEYSGERLVISTAVAYHAKVLTQFRDFSTLFACSSGPRPPTSPTSRGQYFCIIATDPDSNVTVLRLRRQSSSGFARTLASPESFEFYADTYYDLTVVAEQETFGCAVSRDGRVLANTTGSDDKYAAARGRRRGAEQVRPPRLERHPRRRHDRRRAVGDADVGAADARAEPGAPSTVRPTAVPTTPRPSSRPTARPTTLPSSAPTLRPTPEPSPAPTVTPDIRRPRRSSRRRRAPRRAVAVVRADASTDPGAVAGADRDPWTSVGRAGLRADAAADGAAVAREAGRRAPTAADGDLVTFCESNPLDGWYVPTGRMLFGRTFLGDGCLMQSASADYASIYGSGQGYASDRLRVATTVAFNATVDTQFRDFATMFRVQYWPRGNVSEVDHIPGYLCRIDADPDSDTAVLRLREQRVSGTQTTIGESASFDFEAGVFYDVLLVAADSRFACAVKRGGVALATAYGESTTYPDGKVGVMGTRAKFGPHFWADIYVDGVEISPSAAPTAAPSRSFAPTTATEHPTIHKTGVPSVAPTPVYPYPTVEPSPAPSPLPTTPPSGMPTPAPSPLPTTPPSSVPTSMPTSVPTPVPSAPTVKPTKSPTKDGWIDVEFCEDPLDDWSIYSGSFLFGESWNGHSCLMKSNATDYYAVYGSDSSYTDDRLVLSTTLGYASEDETLERDFLLLFRIDDAVGDVTSNAAYTGYQCKVSTDAASDTAVLRLLEEKTSGKEAVLGRSSVFEFLPNTFYTVAVVAIGPLFSCAITSDGNGLLANVSAADRSFASGHVAIGSDPSDLGPHYWSRLELSGTVSTPEPSLAPTSPEPSRSPTTSRPSRSPTSSQPTRSPTSPNPSRPPTSPNPSRSPTSSHPSRSPTSPNPSVSPTSSRPSVSPTSSQPSRSPSSSHPTAAPTLTPKPTAHEHTTISFCDDPRRDGWRVPSGRMLFGRTFMDHDCLMESHSDDYVSIYGSSADYTDDRLQLTTHLAYDATDDFYERDMVSMLRVGEWPLGNVTYFDDTAGYGCKIVTDPGNDVTTLKLREYNAGSNHQALTLGTSDEFQFQVDTFYEFTFRATGAELYCEIASLGTVLATVSAASTTYAYGKAGVLAYRDDLGPHFWSAITVDGTLMTPSHAPTPGPSSTFAPTTETRAPTPKPTSKPTRRKMYPPDPTAAPSVSSVPTHPTLKPTKAPTIEGWVDVEFCEKGGPLDDWSVFSGTMLFDQTWDGDSCLMKSAPSSTDYAVYGSDDVYTDDRLVLSTTLAYASEGETLARDFVLLFRIDTTVSTNKAAYTGYQCKISTEADSDEAVLRLLEEKSSGREAVLSRSAAFAFSPNTFYTAAVVAVGPVFWCAITGDDGLLANATAFDMSFKTGHVAVGAAPSEDPLDDWRVYSGRMLFGEAWDGDDCLLEDASSDYYNVYGSEARYTDDYLLLETELAYASSDAGGERDFYVLFRMQSLPAGNTTDLAAYEGYQCKISADEDGGTAVLRLLEEKSSGKEAVIDRSAVFDFAPDTFYRLGLFARGPIFWCAIMDAGRRRLSDDYEVLANATGYDRSFTDGFVAIGADPSLAGHDYWSRLMVEGTTLAPTAAPTAAPSPAPRPLPTAAPTLVPTTGASAGPTRKPTKAPTYAGWIDVEFCDKPLDDWAVASGRLLFDATWEDETCLLESASADYYAVYGSLDEYDASKLLLETQLGYAAEDETAERDFYVLFRMQALPEGNTTDLGALEGYQCKVSTDADGYTAVLRLLEEKSSGRESVLAKSSSFDFYPNKFYRLGLFAVGPLFWCAIMDAADDHTMDDYVVLANVSGYDKSFTRGHVAIAADPGDAGAHFWERLMVEGTAIAPSAAPTTRAPTGFSPTSGADVDVVFCEEPRDDWTVYSGRMIWDETWEDATCLMKSASPDYYSVYGSDDVYADDALLVTTTVGYDSWKKTVYRDFFILFRMQDVPAGNTTDLSVLYGYQCKIVTDADDDTAVLRLLEEKTNGKEAVLGKSPSFDFEPDAFYDMMLFAAGSTFWCAIARDGEVLANLTESDGSFDAGYVAIADEPSDYGPHYWADLEVYGTVLAPTAKPVAAPVASDAPTPRPTKRSERKWPSPAPTAYVAAPQPTKRSERKPTDPTAEPTYSPYPTPRPTKRNERKTDDDDGGGETPAPTPRPTKRNERQPSPTAEPTKRNRGLPLGPNSQTP